MREVVIINTLGIIPAFMLGLCGVGGLFLCSYAFLLGEPILLPIGLAALVISGVLLFLSPAILGNPYVRYIAHGFLQQEQSNELVYICQVSFSPRLHGGFRGFMEDADDVGHLQISDVAIRFTGDHTEFVLPFDLIKVVSYSNVGWRGFWIAGGRINIMTNALDDYEEFEILERQSNTVITAQRISEDIFHELERRTQSDRRE